MPALRKAPEFSGLSDGYNPLAFLPNDEPKNFSSDGGELVAFLPGGA